MEASPGISIVIPAYNEELFLPATLRATQAACGRFSAATSLPAEIIVVNNASTDQTASVAASLGARVVEHPVRNISSVRNAGLRAAAHTVIVTIDADCFLPEDGLEKIWAEMQDGGCIGGALGVRVLTDRLAMRVIAFLIQTVTERTAAISGAMFFFSRDAALSFGGFPEDKLIAEDSAFAWKIQARARETGRHWVHLKSVQVGTLDRKELSLRTVASVLSQLASAALGRKQKAKDLKYWYDPKR